MVPVGPKEGESFYRSTDQAAPTGAGHRQGAVLVQRRHHERQGRDRILDRRYGYSPGFFASRRSDLFDIACVKLASPRGLEPLLPP